MAKQNLVVSSAAQVGSNTGYFMGGTFSPIKDQTALRLGAQVPAGRTGTSILYLVEQTGGAVVAQTTIDLAATPAGGMTGYIFADLSPAFVMRAGQIYALVSNCNTLVGYMGSYAVTLSADFTPGKSCYISTGSGPGGIYTLATAGQQYFPVDLIYGSGGGGGASLLVGV
jgi:hypothetical protein